MPSLLLTVHPSSLLEQRSCAVRTAVARTLHATTAPTAALSPVWWGLAQLKAPAWLGSYPNFSAPAPSPHEWVMRRPPGTLLMAPSLALCQLQSWTSGPPTGTELLSLGWEGAGLGLSGGDGLPLGKGPGNGAPEPRPAGQGQPEGQRDRVGLGEPLPAL